MQHDRHPSPEEAVSRSFEIARALSNLIDAMDLVAIDPGKAIQSVLQFALKAVEGKFAVLNRFDPEHRRVLRQCGCRMPENLRLSGRAAGRICHEEFVATGKSRAVFGDLDQTVYRTSDPDVIRHQVKAYIGVPVRRNNVVVGSLAVYDDTVRHFSEIHFQWLHLAVRLIGLISEWKDSQALSQQLDESQSLIHQIFQLSPTSIYQVDLRSGRFLKVNQEMCRATGYSQEDLLSMNMVDMLMPESLELIYRRMSEVVAGRAPPSKVELQVKTKSGRAEWGHFHIHYLYDENNMIWGANVVVHPITEQKKAFEELAEYRKRLEALVEERTRELMETNLKLQEEVIRRTETAKELHLKSERLRELNTAMRVLLDKRNEERLRSEENIRVNLVQLIDPFLERLEQSGLNGGQRQLLDVIRMNLNEVTGSPMPELSAKYYIFSPSELQVANLIRKGKTTKDMARLLNISPRTVESFRNSIRKKLGLKKKKVNLKTYLSSKE
jgi:PAS domain S-box-containing protein